MFQEYEKKSPIPVQHIEQWYSYQMYLKLNDSFQVTVNFHMVHVIFRKRCWFVKTIICFFPVFRSDNNMENRKKLVLMTMFFSETQLERFRGVSVFLSMVNH